MKSDRQCGGRVVLVGAGPGDPDLLTLRGLREIEAAQVVVYDRLVSEAILARVPVGAARIDVGKRLHHHPVPQEEINQLLIRLARSGRSIVRLKGGDPLVFGRGGEEVIALREAGIPCEVVPGITSAQGCAAAMAMPLTHRGLASGVRYITGHCRQDEALDFDWAGLADKRTTLVVYMGLANIREIAAALVAHGRAAKTPALAISRGTQPDGRSIATTLGALADDVTDAGLESPVLFVIGEVADLARQDRPQIHDPLENSMAAAT